MKIVKAKKCGIISSVKLHAIKKNSLGIQSVQIDSPPLGGGVYGLFSKTILMK
jgi:hypothetical protein